MGPRKTTNHDDLQESSKTNDKTSIKLEEPAEAHRREASIITSTADIIGEFGLFQLSLSLLTFIRYVSAAMMTNTGSLIAPELDFWCDLSGLEQDQVDNIFATSRLSGDQEMRNLLKGKCSIQLGNNQTYTCHSWTYADSNGNPLLGWTLTDSFDLVCGRDWLRSAFQSSVSTGVVLASVIWGSFSDRHGRYLTIKVCYVCSLLSGLLSCLADDYFVYTLARAICSFGDIGLAVSMITIIVETLGNKFRGAICIIAYTGWAFGVMITPWLTELMSYKVFMIFTVICHLLTLPWILLTIRESVRWSLVNGYFEEAKRELVRIVGCNKWWSSNGQVVGASSELEKEIGWKFDKLREKFAVVSEKRRIEKELVEANWSKTKLCLMSIFGGFSKLNQLLQSKELIVVSLMMIWVTFNCELLYMTTVLINSDIGNDIKLNYFIGGIMETMASIVAIYLINFVTRKLSIMGILLTISSFCLILALTHQLPQISIWVLNLTKLSVSTLSSVIYVTTTELYPTDLRQTGFGVTATLGGLGSVLAPFVRTELVKLIGMTSVMLILVVLPITAVCFIPYFLRETKGVELSDQVGDIIRDTGSGRKASSVLPPLQQQTCPVTTV